MNFEYLKQNLSEQRLSTYLTLANNDKSNAYQLYIKNIVLSQKLHSLLVEFEVLFRNKINLILSRKYGDNWYNLRKVIHINNHKMEIERVKQNLLISKRQQNNANVISNLNLSFWVYLFNKDYDLTIWRSDLHHVFPYKRISRSNVRKKLQNIKNFRNRIAHCECILKHHYSKNYYDIIEIIDWIDPNFSRWINEIIKWK